MNWISRQDKHINIKRKHSNINAIDKLATGNYKNTIKLNENNKNNNNIESIPEIQRNTYHIISKYILIKFI